jgi:hypothetical protein
MPKRPQIPAEVEREILLECGHRCAVCGDPLPLERAHIIPWHKSREHKAEDLICLCANCHERADNGKWGEKTLREYKQRPWVLRRYGTEDGVHNPNAQLQITINMELESFDQKNQRLLQYALAAFLDVPPSAIQIISAEEANSIKVTLKLPAQSADRFSKAYEDKNPELARFLASFPLLAVLQDETASKGVNNYEKLNRMPNLYLAPLRQYVLNGLLGRLARAYGLDVYGTGNLTRRAAIEMKYAALLLTVSFLFNLLGYTLLWNAVFHSGTLGIGWFTALALIAGLIFSLLTLVYERQFLTADYSTPARTYFLAVIIRLAIIASSGFIISQPLQLIVLRNPIQLRVHEESVRAEVFSKLGLLSQSGQEVDAERLRRWASEISKSTPGALVVEQTDAPQKWEFKDEEYTFFDGLRILNDLYYGRPARWRDTSSEDFRTLERYGIRQMLDSNQLAGGPDSTPFKLAYWLVLAIALTVPCLLVAIKALFSIELKTYYSFKMQQEFGNYEALMFSIKINSQPIHVKDARDLERLAS